MMKIGVGWAAGVLTGALAVGGITAAATRVNGDQDACANVETSSASASGCAAADDKSARAAANKTSAAAWAAAQSKLKTATAGIGGTSADATKALATASGLLEGSTGAGAVLDSHRKLESTLAKELMTIAAALDSAEKTVAAFKAGELGATDLATSYNTVNGQLKAAKQRIDGAFKTADGAMKMAQKQGHAALGLSNRYSGLLKTAKGQVDKLYKSAAAEFKGAFGTASNALAITNGVAGLPTIPGAGDAMKQLPIGDPATIVKELTRQVPAGDANKVVEDVKKNLPREVVDTLPVDLPIVGPILGGLL